MSHESMFGEEWSASREEFDRQIAQAVAAGGCRHCGGPLHQGNYERKPRGGQLAEAGEAFTLRHSLCCGREGCRKRALPPSLRFLGRRVYLEGVVLLASVRAMALNTLRQAREATGVPFSAPWWRSSGSTHPAPVARVVDGGVSELGGVDAAARAFRAPTARGVGASSVAARASGGSARRGGRAHQCAAAGRALALTSDDAVGPRRIAFCSCRVPELRSRRRWYDP